MNTGPSQPTILVKKPDGTYTRMTREEFLRQKSSSPAAAAQLAGKTATVSAAEKNIDAPGGALAASSPAPSERMGGPARNAPLQGAEQEKSPSNGQRTSGARENTAAGINAADRWQPEDHKSLLDPSFHEEIERDAARPRGGALATAAPVTDIFVDEAAAAEAAKKRATAPERESRPRETLAMGLPRTAEGRKPQLTDVRPPQPMQRVSMGPVDEIRAMTLVDFRRLSGSAPEREARLREKFMILQKESYLLYLDALRAWRESPLFRLYLSAIDTALATGRPLGAVLGITPTGESLAKEEFDAIVRLGQELGIF